MEKLTNEQKKLVEENHNLIYYVFHKYCKDKKLDDVYGDLAEVLCRSAQKYNQNKKIKFNTYATNSMLNRLKQLHIDENRIKRKAEIISYDTIPKNKEGTKELERQTYLDLFEDKKQNIEDKVMLNSVLRDINDLPPNQKEIMRLLIQNENMSEVARITGISKQCTTEKIRKIQKKLMAKYRG